jgi:heat shock protein HtpX
MNQLKTIFLMGLLSTILIAAGAAIGKGAFYGIIAFTLVMNLATYYFSDKIVLRLHGGRQITRDDDPHLYGMVEELAGRAQLPMPRVFWIDDPQPNAFATGRNPANAAVAVTAGLMHILDDREVRGVIAHELAHIKNRDTLVATVAAVIAGVITTIGSMLQWGAILGLGRSDDEEEGGGAGALLFALIAPIAATLIQLGISRSREFMADKTGAEIADDPEGLARALEKLAMGTARIAPAMARPATASLYIANPFAGSGRGVLNLFSTHPAMDLRIEKLRALPPGSGWSGGEGSSRGGGRSVSARSGGGGARGGFGNPYGT